MGGMIAPVVGSASWPAWMARVEKAWWVMTLLGVRRVVRRSVHATPGDAGIRHPVTSRDPARDGTVSVREVADQVLAGEHGVRATVHRDQQGVGSGERGTRLRDGVVDADQRQPLPRMRSDGIRRLGFAAEQQVEQALL